MEGKGAGRVGEGKRGGERGGGERGGRGKDTILASLPNSPSQSQFPSKSIPLTPSIHRGT